MRSHRPYLICFGALLAMALALPSALANVSGLTLTAHVQSFVILRLETAAGTLVSDDSSAHDAGLRDEVLDFGDIDQLGTASGSLSAINAAASGQLARHMLIAGAISAPGTLPVASGDGALYHVDGAYQLRALRNDGGSDIDIDVDVSGATALDALVSLNGVNSYSPGSGLTGLRAAGAAASDLVDDLGLNQAQLIDLGVFVPLRQTAGPTATVITFTGT